METRRLSFAFILHIHGNTANQVVSMRLVQGANPNEVMEYFNAHPSRELVNYLTHGASDWTEEEKAMVWTSKMDVFGRCI